MIRDLKFGTQRRKKRRKRTRRKGSVPICRAERLTKTVREKIQSSKKIKLRKKLGRNYPVSEGKREREFKSGI